MKVVKIIKNSRNTIREHFLVLLNEPYSDDDINCLVEDWCETDPAGMSYGYTYEWSFVEDENLIKKILDKEIKFINRRIESLNSDKLEIENHLKKIECDELKYHNGNIMRYGECTFCENKNLINEDERTL